LDKIDVSSERIQEINLEENSAQSLSAVVKLLDEESAFNELARSIKNNYNLA